MQARSTFFMIVLLLFSVTNAWAGIRNYIGVTSEYQFLGSRIRTAEMYNDSDYVIKPDYGRETTQAYSIYYNFYFSELADEQVPFELLEFLIHPGQVSLSTQLDNYTYESDIYPKEYEDSSNTPISYSGFCRYYLASGFGFQLDGSYGAWTRDYKRIEDQYDSQTSNMDTNQLTYTVAFQKYIEKTHRIGFRYHYESMSTDYKTDYKTQYLAYSKSYDETYTRNLFGVNLTSALGHAVHMLVDIDLAYATDKTDNSMFPNKSWNVYMASVTSGPVTKNVALLIGFNFAEYDSKEDSTLDSRGVFYKINPVVWINENVRLSFILGFRDKYSDMPGATKIIGYGLLVSGDVRFNF